MYKNYIKPIIVLFLVFTAVDLMAEKNNKTSDLPKVTIAPVFKMDFCDETEIPELFSGFIRPVREIDIRASRKGILREIICREGDIVEKGDVIAKISGRFGLFKEKLCSPLDGIIVSVCKNVDELVMPGDYVAKVIDKLEKILIEIHVPEKDLEKIQLGQKFKFRVPAFPDKEFFGEVDNILPEIMEDGIVKIIGMTDNFDADTMLLPGMSAKINIFSRYYKVQNAVVIPTSALNLYGENTGEKGLYKIFVINNNKKIEERYVQVEYIKDGFSHVSSGIKFGEIVVIDIDKYSANNLKAGGDVIIERSLDNLIPEEKAKRISFSSNLDNKV